MTEINPVLLDAIMMMESRGNLNAGGDEKGGVHRAIGPYQIWKVYYDDAVQKDPTLKADGMKYENCKGEGSKEYSEKVVQAYMNRYATEARLGHEVTFIDIARIHNGGPDGYKKDVTRKYWDGEPGRKGVKDFLPKGYSEDSLAYS